MILDFYMEKNHSANFNVGVYIYWQFLVSLYMAVLFGNTAKASIIWPSIFRRKKYFFYIWYEAHSAFNS